MTTSNVARRLRAGSALSTVALIALGVTMPAFAQAPAAQNVPPAPGQVDGGPNSPAQVERNTGQTSNEGGQEIVVTGSLFKRATATETPSPVTVLSQDTLQKAGITNINDAVRSVSADNAGSISTGFQNGFSAGGAAVSLRGLGVSSTLVLIDGLRTTNFPLNDDGHNAYVDLNSIPFSAVERVEVLKDGASSTYGADAIGGVVNIILRKHVQGVDGGVEGGASPKGYGGKLRANITGGIGDYDANGWNFWMNAEYQHDARIKSSDVRFPFNTTDLSSIGLADQNTADSALNTATTNAVVRRSTQNDINDPFTGGTLSGGYTTLNLNNCFRGTYTVAGAAGGTGCRHDNPYELNYVQPLQERYSFTGRLSIRLSDNVEGYITGSYSHSEVDIFGSTFSVRQRQPYGAAPSTSSLNIVLPYFVCSAGVNCATAADRRLNPNNPYATNAAADPATAAANAARIYYLFGDIQGHSNRANEVIRGTAGLTGSFEDGWDWRVDFAAAKDNLNYTSFSTPTIAGLRQVVNTGAYNFVNPELNSAAVRNILAPANTSLSHSSQVALDASTTKSLFDLPGGPLQLAVGGQIRREVLVNNSQNPGLLNYANTAQAFGKHTVYAAYFELDAPIVKAVEANVSGRYDHYSEGYGRFSPKVGVKFTPIEQVALRGTFSKGFRAPTFAENNPNSSYPGFVTYQPPANFVAAHGGASNPFYTQSYSVGGGFSGNPNLKPEKSRSFTGGIVAQPFRWLSATVDYYNVKKTGTIVAGPDAGKARAAYYSQSTLPAAIAAVAAIPGYSVSAIDAVDPLYPNALPRVLVISGPYVNAGYFKTQGLDFSLKADFPISSDLRFQSRLDVTDILKFNADFGDGVVRKYVGTVGPYELSSGAGTPKWRGNWQNTITFKNVTLTATTYYVSHIKQVAADEEAPGANGQIDLSCGVAAGDLYPFPNPTGQCYIKKFIYADANVMVRVNDAFQFFVNVGNFTNAKAPVAPVSYSGTNYLPTWHIAGVIGRTVSAGARFKF